MRHPELKGVLDKYAETFTESLEAFVTAYKIMGSGTHESPMWFQYREIEEGSLVFKSSQNSAIWFSIRIDEEDVDALEYRYNDVYEYFRTLKYNYISSIHPTVYLELKP